MVQARVISTHALLAEGDYYIILLRNLQEISTHALLAEGDIIAPACLARQQNFNPRPPCGGRLYVLYAKARREPISTHALLAEGDTDGYIYKCKQDNFNPRPPCGGRRRAPPAPRNTSAYFNPRPPCGGRHHHEGRQREAHVISTHALLAEGDDGSAPEDEATRISTHALLAEGDNEYNPNHVATPISTHALLAEGDSGQLNSKPRSHYFNPRPPCGGRPLTIRLGFHLLSIFQPTPSLRRATQCPQARR